MSVPERPVTLRWGARTDKGKTRPTNQDAILATPSVFVVADGMGGHAAGDVASRIAIEAYTAMTLDSRTALRDLVRVTRDANTNILEEVARNPSTAGMGTTVSGFGIGESRNGPYAAVFNVGDSRTYLLRDNKLEQLTTDHSVVQELVDAGDITVGEAATHVHRHVVTRVLGIDPDLEIDTYAVPLRQGDRLLVCSDGLNAVLEGHDLEAAVGHRDSPERVANLLIELALAAGAPDNVSVIVVDVDALSVTAVEQDDVDTLPGLRLPAR